MIGVHVIPKNDDREHIAGRDCWCEPEVEWVDKETGRPWASGGYRALHIAADCRELAEGDGEPMAPDKTWEIVQVD